MYEHTITAIFTIDYIIFGYRCCLVKCKFYLVRVCCVKKRKTSGRKEKKESCFVGN